MGRFGKFLAIGAATVTGPLLAFGAISARDYMSAEEPPAADFDLHGVFVGARPGPNPLGR
jgi:hypothetical protein